MASTDNAGFVSLAVDAQRPAVDLCRAVYGGTLVMREHPEYLPQWEKEEKKAYDTRLANAVLYAAFKKTARSLTAIVFRKNIELGDDVPEEIRGDEEKGIVGHVENIDLAGQHFDLFAFERFLDKVIDGHSITLVDWHGPGGAKSKKAEQQAEARPYWTGIRKGQVTRFRTRTDSGALVPSSFAYEQAATLKKGEFEEVQIRRSHQFDLASRGGEIFPEEEPLPPVKDRRVLFRSWIRMEDEEEWKPDELGRLLGDRMTRIPIAVDYTERTGYLQSEPPLLDLAVEDIRHYQIRADRDTNLHVTSVPVFNTFGLDPDDIKTIIIGTSMGLAFPGSRTEQGSEYTEAQGHGLKHSREELQDIEKRMASLGLSTLERQVRVAETAEATRKNKQAEESELASWARKHGDANEEALQLHAMWMGLEDGGSVEVNTDFDDEIMDPQLANFLLKTVGEGRLSVETMWDRLVAGRILAETFDPEAEKERIALQGQAEMAAVAEALRAERLRQERELESEQAGLEGEEAEGGEESE